jgi:hypothetical protein
MGQLHCQASVEQIVQEQFMEKGTTGKKLMSTAKRAKS